ncbi:MAG TPA: winged helix-turn-helix domain-containing protein, partial [Pyrinomonadaceae bacterium]|nr:winged helix-turn-helix domain-containing protein [Pyrinomonadaceae bacterium]
MSSQTEQHFYEFGPFRVDTLKRLLLRDGQTVPLTAKAFDTLLTFVQHSGHDLDKDELMRTVWPDTIVEENNLTQNVSALRKALGESKSEHRYIVTIPGRGYRFVASVREVCDAEGESRVDAETLRRGDGAAMNGNDANGRNAETENFNASSTSEPGSATPPVLSPLPSVSASLHHSSAFQRRSSASILKSAVLVITVVGILSALAYWWLANRAQSTPGSPAPPGSIAVLPFKALGMNANEDYLGLGMADALITKLSNLQQISVRPTSAVTKFSGEGQTDPVVAGRELNVDLVLEGSIQRAGERVRVTVQLVNVRESRPLWAHTFDERLTDIFTL